MSTSETSPMWSKKAFGNAAFMWLDPAFHQAPRPLVAERHARSGGSPRVISIRRRASGRLDCRHRRPRSLRRSPPSSSCHTFLTSTHRK